MIGKRPKGYRKSWRPCTCHPDDKPPVPCARKYALSECRAAARLDEPQEGRASGVGVSGEGGAC